MKDMEICKLAAAYERLHNDYQYLQQQYMHLQNGTYLEELKQQCIRLQQQNAAFLETHNNLKQRYLRLEEQNDAFEYVLRQKPGLRQYLALKELRQRKFVQEAE